MKNFKLFLATFSAISLATAAYAADANGPDNKTEYTSKDNGGYEVKSESKMTTENGTLKKGEQKVDVDVDDDGSVTKTIKSKSVNDPKGLMNKEEKTSKTKVESNDDGSSKVEKKIEQTDAAGTDTTVKSEAKSDVDSDGNVKTTIETKKVVDPKGLMNKEEVETKTKLINGQVVDQDSDND